LPSLKLLLFGGFSCCYCHRAVFENLPELTSIRLGKNALWFREIAVYSELIMRNLPKLTSLTTDEGSRSFENPRFITLENIPSLTTITLDDDYVFAIKETVHTNNITPALQHYLQ
ncbi:hypothetical protein WA556_004507, partial [Blastocystis sp. ATCC 50177/Nand II]